MSLFYGHKLRLWDLRTPKFVISLNNGGSSSSTLNVGLRPNHVNCYVFIMLVPNTSSYISLTMNLFINVTYQ